MNIAQHHQGKDNQNQFIHHSPKRMFNCILSQIYPILSNKYIKLYFIFFFTQQMMCMFQCKFPKVLLSDTYNIISNFFRNFSNFHLSEFIQFPVYYSLLEIVKQRDIVMGGWEIYHMCSTVLTTIFLKLLYRCQACLI